MANFFGRYKEALLGLFFLVFFALVIVFSANIRILVETGVNAKFWPRTVGILGCIVSLVHLIQGLVNGRAGKAEEDAEDLEISVSGFAGEGKITLALVFLFILGINAIGFLPMAIIYVFLQITVLKPREERNHIKTGAIAVIFCTLVWAVFRYGFDVMLPSGILGRLF
ncbi:MAG: tripartite tricarboxylate transporter TctB family protein [Treponema sp.]|nr:tripartite tricarboxylate transporter TctB family protein [Treponema sp.]